MTAQKTTRPDFLYPGGSPLMHPPLALNNAQMYGFFVRGDLARLQATVDNTLNACSGDDMRFVVFSPFVMLTFTRVHKAFSRWPSDRAKGWGQETDIVTWVMLGQVVKGQPGICRVFFYPCHIFVDDCMALINGRELLGYPKYQCSYTMPEPGQPAHSFSLSAKGFEPFSPDTMLSERPLLEVQAVSPSGQPPKAVAGIPELIEQALALLAANLPAILELDAAGWKSVFDMLRQPGCDQIFLKQFPDGAGVKAVYQAIVAAPAKVKAVYSAELLMDTYQLTLHKFDSFPLNDTLGLALGTQDVLLPFHLHFDFEVTPGEELYDNSRVAPQKIAILGGGVAAMTTAFYLTDQPGWQNRHDVTVYQVGWRLGGKGASGRNAALGERIEEHGLHIWFGFYRNAFRSIQRAYELLGRPPGAPLATWEDAFKPQHFITLSEYVAGQWKQWPIDTPVNDGNPGGLADGLGLPQLAQGLQSWMRGWVQELTTEHAHLADNSALSSLQARRQSGLQPSGWVAKLEALAAGLGREVASVAEDLKLKFDALDAWLQAAPPLPLQTDEHRQEHLSALQEVRAALEAGFGNAATQDGIADTLRRLYICLDLAFTVMAGMVKDGVFLHGLDVINHIDFRDWLKQHGANERLTVDSAPVRGFYDLVFAYLDGDFAQPNIEAGTMLRGMLRVAFGYRGSIMWKMQAGMGDVVFTPYYEVLKARGVKFKFFHQVQELVPEPDSMDVAEVRLTRQVDLADATADYNPLVKVKDLDCWPSQPNYAQIDPAQAALLQQHQVNLESSWSDWPAIYQQAFGKPLPSVSLKRGVDFDKVVFAISTASVPWLCPQLVARSPALQNSCANVKAVATQAYQVWMTKTVPQLGWKEYGRDQQVPVLSAFSEPFDTWAPMDQLLCRETWPVGQEPQNVSYFCSALPCKDYPPFSDHGFPGRMAQAVKSNAMQQLSAQIYPLWPAVATPQGFDWSSLYVPASQGQPSGPARFDYQYWRANVDPSERYVMSVVNSSRHRLDTDGTGFRNLYVTGDWIKTGLNAGCVEAATMAGMQTSRALCGHPQVIAGSQDD